MAHSKTYQAWADMKQRCNNHRNAKFSTYGARSIDYPEAWETFLGFFNDMKEAPEGGVLDRRDNEKGYSAENCRWVTHKESARNTRRIKLTVRKVQLIRAILRSIKPGVSQKEVQVLLADMFGVGFYCMRAVCVGDNWHDVV